MMMVMMTCQDGSRDGGGHQGHGGEGSPGYRHHRRLWHGHGAEAGGEHGGGLHCAGGQQTNSGQPQMGAGQGQSGHLYSIYFWLRKELKEC